MPVYHQNCKQYRQELFQKFEGRKGILHNGFWYYVYNQYHVERWAAEDYFRRIESNPVLKSFPEEHAAGLTYLFLRRDLVRSNPAACFWFVLWDDFNRVTGLMMQF